MREDRLIRRDQPSNPAENSHALALKKLLYVST